MIPHASVTRLTSAFQSLLRVALALLPMAMIVYLQLLQDPRLDFKSHWLHELSIAISTLVSGFATHLLLGVPDGELRADNPAAFLPPV